VRNRYAKLRGLEGGSWEDLMQHFGIKAEERPARVPIALNGPARLTKAEAEALKSADLANDLIRPGDQGTAEKLRKRGWIDDSSNLTDAGRAAVYSYREHVREQGMILREHSRPDAVEHGGKCATCMARAPEHDQRRGGIPTGTACGRASSRALACSR
jgi:hypothetical protein